MSIGRPVLEADRERAMWRIRAAVDDGVLDLAEAGRRLLAIHHAGSDAELRGLLADLSPSDVGDRDGERRFGRALRWARIGLIVLVVLAAMLALSLLPGPGPFDVV